MVWIFGSWLDDGNDRSRSDKPRQVVNVAMRVVAFDTPPSQTTWLAAR